MSKQIKQMEMDALKKTFTGVRDLVFLSISGVDATAENQMRLALRKKKINLRLVKNSLAARVFQDLGLAGFDAYWREPTTVAWGGTGIAELSKELEVWIKKNAKIKPKVALADGAVIPFETAKKFPTRSEALSRVITLALSPASQLVGQLRGPAARVASQLKTIGEKAPAEPAAAS